MELPPPSVYRARKLLNTLARRTCEHVAEQQAEALTRCAYEYSNRQLHDVVAALVDKVRTVRAA
jgi:hypothetical protein